jgi:hypothetical protein
MRRVAAIGGHVLGSHPAAYEADVAYADAEVTDFDPSLIFGRDAAVDDAFVQRFLTEGFCTLTPDTAPGTNDEILRKLRVMTPAVVRSKEEGEALGGKPYMILKANGGAQTPEGNDTFDHDNSSKAARALPELEEMLEAPNVKAVLTGLLGNGYMVDSARGSNFTRPGRSDSNPGPNFHRDGNDKRRHHHPRMLMGLYYPQETTIDMGPTAVVARSHWYSDFSPGFQDHRVVSVPRQTTPLVNMDGDYLGTGRGTGGSDPLDVPPEPVGIVRLLTVPAGTLLIMCV